MSTEKQYALTVNNILPQYIAIHDDILKTSIRRIIPIPGIFQAIDYGSHSKALFNLESQLMTIIAALTLLKDRKDRPASNIEFAAALENYTRALMDSVTRLKDICEKLYMKSQGESGYDMAVYNKDMDNYKISTKRYYELGDALNALYNKLD